MRSIDTGERELLLLYGLTASALQTLLSPKKAVLAGNAEFDPGLGGVADARGFEVAGVLTVDHNEHCFADGLDDEGAEGGRQMHY